MQYLYRGIHFETNSSSIDTPQMDVAGTYRGLYIPFRNPQVSAPSSVIPLQYRGITYLRSR